VCLDGRKCLLLAHAVTLFSVFVADVRKAELRSLGVCLADTIRAALCSESCPEDAVGRLDPG
jgi:hypothetical protein